MRNKMSESEFAHILSTSLLVGEGVKSAAMEVFRKMGISKMFMNDEELDYIISYDFIVSDECVRRGGEDE